MSEFTTFNQYNTTSGGYSSKEVEKMNRLLRGEISATEAYKQVMEKINKDPESFRLSEFLDDHRQAVSYWKKQVNEQNVEADNNSGPWGTVVESFVGTAKLLGNTAALKALKEGEEHGLKEYKEMLDSGDLSNEHRQYVQDVLIPNQQRHITSIDAMMNLQ